MDEMKIKLSTRFMKNIVSKIIARALYKKFGYKINVTLNELDVKVINGETKVSTNLELMVDSDEFMNIIKSIGLD